MGTEIEDNNIDSCVGAHTRYIDTPATHTPPTHTTHTRYRYTHTRPHTLELCEVGLGVLDAIVIVPEVGGHGGEGLGTHQLPTVVKHRLTYKGVGQVGAYTVE